ncbi:MAG: Rrf2 family transcriptional regulator [Nitrospira sp.]|nr:Rrf2 family transcriptional regulator [Nitrospira sp.]MDH4302994.1 Rrf2 family transcriptional regulator [Nitrospira sp.]MDH5193924.1 Rrf2 family transcriptional regulator [Nitrospira sp.]
MKMSKRVSYGILTAIDLAIHAKDAPIQAKAVSRRQGIPLRFLEQVLHTMKNAGLVESHRGAQGGYVLARKSENLSLAEIFESLEGSVFHQSGVNPLPRHRHMGKSDLLLGDVCEQLQQAERKVLESITVEQLAARQRLVDAQRSPMYHI